MPKVELILRDIRDERAETTGLARPEKMVVDTEGNFTIGNKVIKFDLRVFKGFHRVPVAQLVSVLTNETLTI